MPRHRVASKEGMPPRTRSRPQRRTWAAAAAVGLLLPLVVRATSVEPKSFAQLCAEADVIFVGTATAVRAQWADPDRRAIETLVTFGDVTAIAGDADTVTTLRFGGGEVDDIREEVAGVPRFAVGDRVLLFARHGRSVSPLAGFNQGYFRVIGGERPVLIDVGGRPVLGVRNGAIEIGSADAAAQAVPLETFLETVRREVAAQRRE
jgi:hypothetical protein